MGVNLQEFMKDKILGNVRSGARGENDKPIKLAHFDVHEDKTTSALAVEIFNGVYNNPDKLKIRFINQHPIEVFLERYEGRKRKCYGNNKEAIFLDDKGKKQKIECNKDCPYREEKECKYVAKLYFQIEKLEDEGIWCYPIGSEKGIRRISARIARANRKKEDLTKDWYELFLRAEDAPFKGKNYIPDIRKIETIVSDKKSLSEENEKAQNTIKTDYLMLKSFDVTTYKDNEVPKVTCIDINHQRHEFILMPNSRQDILKVKPKSIILPVNIIENDEYAILHDYKIVKKYLEKIENKKVV